MSTISYLASLVQQAVGRMNAYEANAKKVDELPHQTTLEPTSKLPVSRGGISEHVTVQQIISSIQNSTYNQLLAIGDIAVDGTDIIVDSGVSGQINGLIYGTSTETTIPITLCGTGLVRRDILVLTTSNTVVTISGEETDGTIIFTPPTPTDAVYITFFDINDSEIGAPDPPITGTQFKKKDESRRFSESLTGADQVIELRAAGQASVSVIGTGLTSITGFSTALITSNPTADPLYTGKDILFSNDTDAPVTLKNEFSGVDVAFKFGADLIVPIGGKVWMKYYSTGLELVMKSWSDSISVPVFSDVTTHTHTGTTSYTRLVDMLIPANTIQDGDVWETEIVAKRTTSGFSSNCFVSSAIGTENEINGFIRGVSVGNASSNRIRIKRSQVFKSGVFYRNSNSGSWYHDFQVLAGSTLSFDETIDNYVRVGLTLSSSSDIGIIEYVIFRKIN